jgi:hypothetical protein
MGRVLTPEMLLILFTQLAGLTNIYWAGLLTPEMLIILFTSIVTETLFKTKTFCSRPRLCFWLEARMIWWICGGIRYGTGNGTDIRRQLTSDMERAVCQCERRNARWTVNSKAA